MSKKWILSSLESLNNSMRTKRKEVSNVIWNNPDFFEDLITIVFDVDNKTSINAAWVMEWICTHKDLQLIVPHLDFFTKNIGKLHFDGAIRPCAKICQHLAIAYSDKKSNLIKQTITKQQINNLIETGFDWLITPQKIAVKVYTITFLYYFGLEKDWIHNELEYAIRSKIIHQSKGCEKRGNAILKLITEHRNCNFSKT